MEKDSVLNYATPIHKSLIQNDVDLGIGVVPVVLIVILTIILMRLVSIWCMFAGFILTVNIVEKYYGKLKFLLIYLGSGVIGSLFSVVLTNYASVGASGAIFGLFGALLFFGYKYRATLDGFLRSSIVPTLILNLIIGLVIPGIDISAHIGGLIGGILFSYSVGVVNKKRNKDKINGIIILIIMVAFLVYMLMNK